MQKYFKQLTHTIPQSFQLSFDLFCRLEVKIKDVETTDYQCLKLASQEPDENVRAFVCYLVIILIVKYHDIVNSKF